MNSRTPPFEQIGIVPDIDVLAIGQEAPAGRQGQKGEGHRAQIREVLDAERLIEVEIIARGLAGPEIPAIYSVVLGDAKSVERPTVEGLKSNPDAGAGPRRGEVRRMLATEATLTVHDIEHSRHLTPACSQGWSLDRPRL